MKSRISYIDFLKFLGLSLIVLAHVNPPNWLFIIRSFDVPLMVIISSYLASYSINKYQTDIKSIAKYYYSRIKRLVFPTWLFLTFWFILQIAITKQSNTLDYYIHSFLLTRYGIGFVWIILIYLYSALLVPLYKKIGYKPSYTLLFIVIYILYEVLYYYKIGLTSKFIETTLYYIIPYGLLTYIGFNYNKINSNEKVSYLIVSFLTFVLLLIYYWCRTGEFQSMYIAKYPPRLYFLSYGIFCSMLLMTVFQKFTFKIYENKIVTFISKKSLSIYLWHILALELYDYTFLPDKWYIKLLFVYILAIALVWCIDKIKSLVRTQGRPLKVHLLRTQGRPLKVHLLQLNMLIKNNTLHLYPLFKPYKIS